MSDLSRPIVIPRNLPYLFEFIESDKKSPVKPEAANHAEPVSEDKFGGFLNRWVEETMTAFEKKEEIDLEEVLSEIKEIESAVGKAFIHRTLKATHGNRKETAKRLQISMRKLRYLMNEKSSVQ